MRSARLQCPECANSIPVYEDEVGTRGVCPSCGADLEVSASLFGAPQAQAASEPFGDWPDELALDTDEPRPPAPPPAEPRAPAPAADAAADRPAGLELDSPTRPAAPTGRPPARGKRPGPQAPSAAPRFRGAVSRRAMAPPGPQWAEGFLGAFVYAYVAVLAGDAWKAWLRYAAIGTIVPVFLGAVFMVPGLNWAVPAGFFLLLLLTVDIKHLIPVAFIFLPLALLVSFGAIVVAMVAIGAPAGALYFYMIQASALGARPIEGASPNLSDDIMTPGVLVIQAGFGLLVIPMAVAGYAAKAVGGGNVLGLLEALVVGGDVGAALAQPAALTQLGILAAGGMFALFCFPMVAMILGSSEEVLRALNPLNVARGILKAPLEYVAVWAFCVANVIAATLGFAVVSAALAATAPTMAAGAAGFFAFMLIFCYGASACGWRMGIFLRRHPELEDVVG